MWLIKLRDTRINAKMRNALLRNQRVANKQKKVLRHLPGKQCSCPHASVISKLLIEIRVEPLPSAATINRRAKPKCTKRH